MGKQARLRAYSKRMNMEQPLRLVPSKRGLATAFTIAGVLGFGAGACAELGLSKIRAMHASPSPVAVRR